MNKQYRLPVLLLVLALVLGLFAGCGSSTPGADSGGQTAPGEEGGPEGGSVPAPSGDAVHLVIMTGADQPEQPDGPMVWDEIGRRMQEDGLNITIEVRSYAWGDYKEQVNRMAAAGEKFDIYLNFQGDLPGDVARKQCIELEEIIQQYGPNILAMTPESLFSDVSVSGSVYGVPANYPFVGDSATMIRKDLREKYDIPEITSLELFEEYLDAVTTNEGNISGMAGRNGTGGGNFSLVFGSGKYMRIGADLADFGQIDVTQKPYVVQSHFETDFVLAEVEWKRKAYENGWIPPDTMTVTDPNTMLVSGKAASITNDMWTVNSIGPIIRQNIEGGEIETFSFVNFDEKVIRLNKLNNFASISSTSDHPVEAIQFLDWLRADKSNYDLYMLGIEGIHWEEVDENTYRLPEGVDPAARTYNPSPWWCRSMQYDRNMEGSEPGFLFIYEKVLDLEYETPDIIDFNFDTDPVKTEWAQLDTAYMEIWGPIKEGIDPTEEGYQNALRELDSLGLQTVLEEVQRQLDEWAAENGIYD